MPTYLRPIIDDADDDPGALQAAMEELLAARIPGWVPRAASPARYMLEGMSIEAAENRRLATGEGQTFDAIARYFGTETFAIPAEDPIAATTSATFGVKDVNGPYDISEGLQLTLAAADGTRVGFEVVETVTVPAGVTTTSAGEVSLVAVEAGAAGNGLISDPELEEFVDYITTIVINAPTSGGSDGETDADYLDRFTRAALRFSPRLITARDLELYAADWPGAERAIAYDLRDPGVNEVQTILHAGTGGTLTLTFEGQTTAAIAWNATAATVQLALEALSNVDPGDVLVTGGPWPALMTFEFTNLLAASNRTQMTASNASLTPAASAITIATTVGGVAPATAQERKATVSVIDALGNALSATEMALLQAAMIAGVETGKLVYVRAPSYKTVDVVFAATAYPGYTAAAVESDAENAVADFLSPAMWGRPTFGDQPRWFDEPTVRFREVVAVLENVPGLWHVDSLTIMGAANTDYTLPGPKPNLPRPGTITGTITPS